MNTLAHKVLLASMLLTGIAEGQVRMQAVEVPLESTTSHLSLPHEIPASVTIAPCPEGCVPIRLYLQENSKFLLGNRSLTFQEFSEAAEKPSQNIAIFYDAKTHVISRMVISSGVN